MYKPKSKRFLLLLVVWIMTILCAAGSAYAASPVKGIDHKETVLKAYQNFEKLKSFRMNLNANLSMPIQGRTMKTLVQGEFDILAKPLVSKCIMNMTMEFDGEKNQEKMAMYMEESGGQLTVYTNAGKQWIKRSMPYSNPVNDYEGYIKAIDSVTLLQENSRSIVYEVTASGQYLQEALERSLASSGMSQLNLPPDLLRSLDGFKYTITIDKKTMIISEMNMDLSGVIAKIADKTIATQKIPPEQKQIMKAMFSQMKVTMQIKLSQFNRIKKITIPDEVKKGTQSIRV